MKYVMMQYTFRGVQYHYAVLFPENLVHSMVADCMRHYKHGTEKDWVRAKPVSAGFVSIDSGPNNYSIVTHGKSESLNMQPHPDDAQIIDLEHNGSAMFERDVGGK